MNEFIGVLIGGLLGGIFTILGGWLTYIWQIKSQERNKKHLVNAIAQGVADELSIFWEGYSYNVGNTLKTHNQEEPFLFLYPIKGDYTKIYDDNLGLITCIKEDEIRKAIVLAYVRIKGLILTFQFHAELVREYDQVFEQRAELWQSLSSDASYSGNEQKKKIESKFNVVSEKLIFYTKGMKDHSERTEKSVLEAIDLLENNKENIQIISL